MFDLNTSDFAYELEDCELINVSTGAKVGMFDARDVTEVELRGGYIAGVNLANISGSRMIATTSNLGFKPINHNVVIDGGIYRINAIRYFKHRAVGEQLINQDKEIVLELI